MLGLTRDNVSGNALVIGVLVGCIVGGRMAPALMGADPADFKLDSNSTAAAAANASTSSAADSFSHTPHLHASGWLGAYLASLQSFGALPAQAQWATALSTLLLLLVAKLLAQWFLRPFEYSRNYSDEKRMEAAYLRTQGAAPPGYPNTWYKICDSSAVPRAYSEGAFAVDVLGERVFVLRLPASHPFGEELNEGEVVVLVESSLNGVDPTRDLAGCGPAANPLAVRWVSQEVNRMIFCWHHDDNHSVLPASPREGRATPTLSSPQQPQWPIPLIAGIEGWRYHGSVTHEIASALQEIPENGADVAHLEYIHGDFLLSWLGKIVRHTWSAVWDPCAEPTGHIAKLVLTQDVTLFGFKIPFTKLDSNIDQVGPALVQLIFPTPFGKVCVVETVTPIMHTLQRAQNVLYAEPTVPRFMAKIFLMGLVVQFERDLPIWNHKNFLRRPLIIKEDGPVLKYRRWVKQFYTDASYRKVLEENAEFMSRYNNE